MKKQTAVEWLEEQMLTWGDKPRWMRDDMVKQAKEMEKEQIENAYKRGKKHKKPVKDSNPITKFKSE